MAGGESDEPGVLGNLPRSRPGTRSDKRRAGGARSGGGAARSGAGAGGSRAKASGAGKTSSSPARAAASAQRAKRSSAGTRPSASRQRQQQQREAQRKQAAAPKTTARTSRGGDDPLTQAVQLPLKVAETGLKLAAAVVKRLPHP